MTTASVLDCREPTAEYEFSDFGTSREPTPYSAQPWPFTSKASASLLVTSAVVLGALTGTSSGGQTASIAPFVTVGRTDRGELAPLIAPRPQPVVVRADTGRESRGDREEVAWIKEHSGLTWDQLGKVFGVSRRAVHMWANGGRLNESNALRLRAFSAVISREESRLVGSTPERVRARLLQIESDGLSIVDRLRNERSAGLSWGAPYSPERLVGAIREPVRTPVGEVEHE